MFTKKSISIIHSLTIFLTLLALTFSAIGVTPAHAATFTVTKTADTNDGTCGADCSLREAIADANASAGTPDTIILPAGTYTLTLGSQLPAVTSAITIHGSGVANTIIQPNASANTATYRVFEVTSTGDLTLDSLTVRNGRCNGSCANVADSGGGILNGGALIVSNVTFNANSATLGGGGMFNYNGSSPTLTNVTFSGNSATGGGGGMYNYISSPTLTNVTFSANSTVNLGGGMYNFSSSVTLTNATFSANSASNGGGIYNEKGSPTLTNVTFSANSANTGGGMYNYISSPTLTNVTFSANSANTGGGMYNFSNSSPTLKNTLIANSPSGGDCVSDASTLNASSSNNLIEASANACGLTNSVNGNIVGQDPALGALANNGGFTQTHALLTGSPAINKGTNTGCPATDQRGITRPQGAHCDIGAFEFVNTVYLPLVVR